MQLTDILKPQCIRVPLAATDRQGAIYELVDLLAAEGTITDAEAARSAVWQRESTRTTGIGAGLAIPHGKCVGCDSLTMAIGKPAEPIDFQSIDHQPVNLIFLLVSQPDQTGPHIQSLARVSRLMEDDAMKAKMANAQSAEEIYQLISEHEAAGVE